MLNNYDVFSMRCGCARGHLLVAKAISYTASLLLAAVHAALPYSRASTSPTICTSVSSSTAIKSSTCVDAAGLRGLMRSV